ncbi:MAG: lactate permease LctP family transporter [Firmicutes bacterium]|nr:lactate permease LctP family transporter [Bacillota bacterium]
MPQGGAFLVGEWVQPYDPAGSFYISVLAAAAPLALLLTMIVVLRIKSYIAGGITLAVTCAEATLLWRMPAVKAAGSVTLGAAFALFPIAYIVVGSLFLYNLAVQTGRFTEIRRSLEAVSRDRRIQAILVGYCFAAFLDSTTGFLTPVTITASILAGLGFPPVEAARLGLLGASMPSAFGAMGLSIVVLSQVSGLSMDAISIMSGRQMPFLSLAMPFVLLARMAGMTPRILARVLPHALATGATYAFVLFAFSNYISHYSAALAAAVCGLVAAAITARIWPLNDRFEFDASRTADAGPRRGLPPVRILIDAWMPFILLNVVVLVWTVPQVQSILDAASLQIPVAALHNLVLRTPPAVPRATPMAAVLNLNWLSAAGTGILVAAVSSVVVLRVPLETAASILAGTVRQVRLSILTMVTVFGAAYLMNYSGMSTTLALAIARSGRAFPFLSPILGWLGAVMVGSNTASDAMFASLQVMTANRVGMPPVLAVAGNGVAAVFGKMLAPQTLAVAASVAGIPGEESVLFRRIVLTSVMLAVSVGLISVIQAYLVPGMIP